MHTLHILWFVVLAVSIWLAFVWERAWTPSESTTLAEITTVELASRAPDVATVTATLRTQVSPPRDAPILLVLHGGPGASDIPFLHQSDNLLEQHFLIVHYDQRSAGKSCRYHGNQTHDALSIDQHVQDVVSMIEYLKRRFQQDKIYLMGNSWGTVLALLVARDYSHLLRHVALRGTVVATLESERLSNDYIVSVFPEFSKLQIGPPYGSRADDLAKQRKWLYAAGGFDYSCRHSPHCHKLGFTFKILMALLKSSEMSWGDLVRFKACYMKTMERLLPELETFDARKQVPQVNVPILFLHGQHDHCCAAELIPEYFQALEAPQKRLIWFEKSAHQPNLEEPELFQEQLINEFLVS